MDDCGFDTARKTILKQLGKYSEAAEIHLRDGEIEEAVDCFLESEDPRSHHQAAHCLLQGLWVQAFGANLDHRWQSLLPRLERLNHTDLSLDEKRQARPLFFVYEGP